MRSHLLAAVSFAIRKNQNVFHVKSQVFGQLRENNIHRNTGARITHVVIYHDEWRSLFQNASGLCDDAGHFVKVTPYHSRDPIIVEEIQLFQPFEVSENRLQ